MGVSGEGLVDAILAELALPIAHAAPRKRDALAGTGGRSSFFYNAITTRYSSTTTLVALCDTNQTDWRFESYRCC